MAEKKTFVLRIDAEVYKALEKWASDEFRSVNGQIEWILFQKLKDLKTVSKKRKDLAQILTVIKQKELLGKLESKVKSIKLNVTHRTAFNF